MATVLMLRKSDVNSKLQYYSATEPRLEPSWLDFGIWAVNIGLTDTGFLRQRQYKQDLLCKC